MITQTDAFCNGTPYKAPRRTAISSAIHLTEKSNLFSQLTACLLGGGGPQIGEVTCGVSPHLSCKHYTIWTGGLPRPPTCLRACLHEGGGGGTQGRWGNTPVNIVSHFIWSRSHYRLGHYMRNYMDKRVTSPIWGPPPPSKQALSLKPRIDKDRQIWI